MSGNALGACPLRAHVDPRLTRFSAGATAGVLAVVLLIVDVARPLGLGLLASQVAVFAFTAFVSFQWSLWAQIYARFIWPRIGAPTKLEDARPHEIRPVPRLRVHCSGADLLRSWRRRGWLQLDGTRLWRCSTERFHRAVFGLQGLRADSPTAVGLTPTGRNQHGRVPNIKQGLRARLDGCVVGLTGRPPPAERRQQMAGRHRHQGKKRHVRARAHPWLLGEIGHRPRRRSSPPTRRLHASGRGGANAQEQRWLVGRRPGRLISVPPCDHCHARRGPPRTGSGNRIDDVGRSGGTQWLQEPEPRQTLGY